MLPGDHHFGKRAIFGRGKKRRVTKQEWFFSSILVGDFQNGLMKLDWNFWKSYLILMQVDQSNLNSKLGFFWVEMGLALPPLPDERMSPGVASMALSRKIDWLNRWNLPWLWLVISAFLGMKCYPGLEEIKKPLVRNPSWWTNRISRNENWWGIFHGSNDPWAICLGGWVGTWQIRWTRLSWMIAKFSTRNHDNLRVALYEGVINHHCPLLISTRKNPQPIIGSFMSWSSWRVKVDINDISNSTLVDNFRGWPWLYWRKLGG